MPDCHIVRIISGGDNPSQRGMMNAFAILPRLLLRVLRGSGHGRNAGYPAPPVQIRT